MLLSTEVSEIFTRLLNCPGCGKTLAGAWFQCETGHSICVVCHSNLQKCPSPKCSSELTDTRNFLVEQIALNFSKNCKYSKNGCRVLILDRLNIHPENPDHNKLCEFRPIKCTLFKPKSLEICGQDVKTDSYISHLMENHNINTEAYEGLNSNEWIQQKVNEITPGKEIGWRNVPPIQLRHFDGENFLLVTGEENLTMYWWVYHLICTSLNTDNINRNYLVTITLKNQETEVSTSFTGPAYSVRISPQEIIKSGLCLVVNRNMLKVIGQYNDSIKRTEWVVNCSFIESETKFQNILSIDNDSLRRNSIRNSNSTDNIPNQDESPKENTHLHSSSPQVPFQVDKSLNIPDVDGITQLTQQISDGSTERCVSAGFSAELQSEKVKDNAQKLKTNPSCDILASSINQKSLKTETTNKCEEVKPNSEIMKTIPISDPDSTSQSELSIWSNSSTSSKGNNHKAMVHVAVEANQKCAVGLCTIRKTVGQSERYMYSIKKNSSSEINQPLNLNRHQVDNAIDAILRFRPYFTRNTTLHLLCTFNLEKHGENGPLVKELHKELERLVATKQVLNYKIKTGKTWADTKALLCLLKNDVTGFQSILKYNTDTSVTPIDILKPAEKSGSSLENQQLLAAEKTFSSGQQSSKCPPSNNLPTTKPCPQLTPIHVNSCSSETPKRIVRIATESTRENYGAGICLIHEIGKSTKYYMYGPAKLPNAKVQYFTVSQIQNALNVIKVFGKHFSEDSALEIICSISLARSENVKANANLKPLLDELDKLVLSKRILSFTTVCSQSLPEIEAVRCLLDNNNETGCARILRSLCP